MGNPFYIKCSLLLACLFVVFILFHFSNESSWCFFCMCDSFRYSMCNVDDDDVVDGDDTLAMSLLLQFFFLCTNVGVTIALVFYWPKYVSYTVRLLCVLSIIPRICYCCCCEWYHHNQPTPMQRKLYTNVCLPCACYTYSSLPNITYFFFPFLFIMVLNLYLKIYLSATFYHTK